jgi:hypothetical protein
MNAGMAFLARYPLSSSVVLAALAATASVFLFARPHYHPPNQGQEVKLDLSKYPPATDGWTWEHGQPGFRFGDDDNAWNVSQVKPAELSSARGAARRWGVAPGSVRLISAIRLGPGDLSMIVAGTNAADRTCLGFVTPSKAPSFYCGARLDRVAAFILVNTRSSYLSGEGTVHPTFFTGIARSDVTRVVVEQRPDYWPSVAVYDRQTGSLWGTVEVSFSDWQPVTMSVFGKQGLIAAPEVRVTKAGDGLVTIPG